MKFRFSITILLALLCATIMAQKSAITSEKWINSDQTMVLKFYENNGKYFGKIVWLKDSLEESGEPKRDIYNENPKLRSRKVLGTNLILNMERKHNDTKWTNGSYYYYETGNTYNAQMYIEGDTLYIKGYWWWFKFLGKTREWIRLED
jgi:uncharacterized protein (DUF2147 family)